jgi:hypothetical protein
MKAVGAKFKKSREAESRPAPMRGAEGSLGNMARKQARDKGKTNQGQAIRSSVAAVRF